MNWFKHLKLRLKLTIGFAFMIVFMAVIGLTGYNSTRKVQNDLEEIFNVRLPSTDYLLQVDRDLQQLLVAERSMIFANVDSDIFKEMMEEYRTNLQQAEERWQQYEQLPSTSEEQTLMNAYQRARTEWRDVSRQVVEGRSADTREGRRLALDLTLGPAKQKFEAMRDQIDKLTEMNLAIAKKSHEAAQATYRGTVKIMAGMVVLGLCVGVAMALIISNAIATPVKAAVAGLRDIAEGEGDLTMRLQVSSRDEVGELARWFNKFIEKLQGIIKEIARGVETLSTSSTELSAISQHMSQAAQNTSGRCATVATASEEMSANMNTVAAAMEQSATNTQVVATAAEEMSATIGEIAKNSEKARGISDQAATQAADTSVKVAELGRAAQAIGKVVETITDISEQVNLLALNATIEAARAGEAGKGFAVVANEIKELARQTAAASQDIKEKIGSIQGTTSVTIDQIDQITKVIKEVNDVVSGIATAVEEQSSATSEIATNVAQAAQGIQEVNTNVGQSSLVATDISKEIADVNASANEMSSSGSQVNISAQDLSQLSEQLRGMVNQFKI